MRILALPARSLLFLPGILAIASLGFSQNPPASQESQDDVVRVSTTLVTVTVNARDRHGKVVRDLQRGEFHLFEDGVEQEITYFDAPKGGPEDARAAAALPLTVALLLDVSDSTEFKLDQIQKAALAFIDQLEPDDRVLVIAFDKRIRVLAEATKDRAALREAIARVQTGGGTSLYMAIDIAINHQLKNIGGRKTIVLFTDGVDTASVGATMESTASAAARSNAVIYPVQYNTYGDFADSPSRQASIPGGATGGGPMITAHATKNGELASEAYKRATNYLRLLAQTTGGHVEYSDSVKNLSRAFGRIALQLGQQYTLGYYPKNRAASGLQRQIKVRVARPNVSVSARKTYVYAPPH